MNLICQRTSMLVTLVIAVVFTARSFGAAPVPSLVPLPASVAAAPGEFTLTSSSGVFAARELPGARDSVGLLLGTATGFAFADASDSEAAIRILYVPGLASEAYRLEAGQGGIVIGAATDAGVFYALQTLRQLLPAAIFSPTVAQADWTVPGIVIEDEPRFSWRGLHLDVGRHFMPVEFVKKYIDVLAAHKMNTFHWHLTEDQGWRIEIKQYPKLTEIGSRRAQTVISGGVGDIAFKDPDEFEYDGVPHGGFYTQDEVREVVAYAAARHVTVVPEIEFPGHAQAAIAAYPELGNTGEQLKVKEEWGISKNTIKPSEQTLQFYRNVLDEVLALFPSRYIHIGGDEAPKDQWEASEYAQQRMRELGLADAHELQSWLIGQIDQYLSSQGRSLVGWDEIMQGGLSENATVMSWRGMQPGLRAAARGHDVIMAPIQWTYFDYYQADPKGEPVAIGSYLPLKTAYEFDPAPADMAPELRSRILGAQGQLWTEYMKTPDHVEYMAYPRAVALAEVVWSPREGRDYASFQQRLPAQLERLDVLQVNYRPPGGDGLSFGGHIKAWFWRQATRMYMWWENRKAGTDS